LPWVKVDKNYMFRHDPDGRRFGDLFGGNSQLIVQHFCGRHDLDCRAASVARCTPIHALGRCCIGPTIM